MTTKLQTIYYDLPDEPTMNPISELIIYALLGWGAITLLAVFPNFFDPIFPLGLCVVLILFFIISALVAKDTYDDYFITNCETLKEIKYYINDKNGELVEVSYKLFKFISTRIKTIKIGGANEI